MDEPLATAEERAEQRRRTWAIRRVPVDSAMLASESSAADRVARMYQLSIDPWVLRGEPLPSYSRENMPGRLVRGSKP